MCEILSLLQGGKLHNYVQLSIGQSGLVAGEGKPQTFYKVNSLKFCFAVLDNHMSCYGFFDARPIQFSVEWSCGYGFPSTSRFLYFYAVWLKVSWFFSSPMCFR